MIQLRNVSFGYGISNVSLTIEDGDFIGITGKMGSGKTTFCKLICGIAKPTSGQIKRIGRVAFAMQFPESQLFESTVIKDVMFGPLNRGLGEKESWRIAWRCLESVGIGEDMLQRSPLSLSGGERRLVALAGVLAMEADTLVLDEPTAGLDPNWHDDLFALLRNLNTEGKTIIVVSHDMDDIAAYCRSLMVLEDGKVRDFGNTRDVISRQDGLWTRAMAFAARLRQAEIDVDPEKAITVDDLANLIAGSKAPR